MDFTAEGILSRMKASLKNEDTRIEGSFTMDNLQAVSEELARFYVMQIIPLMNTLEEWESDMGTSGNERHYVQWAKEAKDAEGKRIAGNAKVSSPRDGTGNVYIAIMTTDAQVPTEEKIRMVQEYIDKMRPVGANPIVTAVESIPIKISCSIKTEAGYTEETLTTKINEAVREYFLRVNFQGGMVSLNYYRIGNIIGGVEGVKELTELTVNDDKDSISADFDKYFSLEELNVYVTEQ